MTAPSLRVALVLALGLLIVAAPACHKKSRHSAADPSTTNPSPPTPNDPPANTPPVADAITVSVAEDGSVAITLTGSDDDGDILHFTVLTTPSHGTLSGTAPDLVFTPNADYFGADSFTFRASDQEFHSDATVSIDVTSVNDLPTTQPESFTATGNTVLTVDAASSVLLNDSDLESSSLTCQAGPLTSSNGGDVTMMADGSFAYVGAPAFTGTDTFEYTALDGDGGAVPGTVTIDVQGMFWYVDNSAPAPGDGRSNSPFQALFDVEAVSSDGETILVAEGDGTTQHLDQGFVMKPGQTLIGGDDGPHLSNTGGAALTLASGVTIENIVLDGASGAGLHADGITGADLVGVSISGCATGVDFQGLSGTVTFDELAIDGATQKSFAIASSSSATVTIDTLAVTTSAGAGIDLNDAGVVTVTSGTLDVAGGVGLAMTETQFDASFSSFTVDNSAGAAVAIESHTGMLQLSGVQLTTSGGAALTVSGTGTLSISGGSNHLSATGAPALIAADTNLNATFYSVSCSSASTGISLTNIVGAVDVTGDGSLAGTGGTISDTSGDAIVLDNVSDSSFRHISFTNIGGRGLHLNQVDNLVLVCFQMSNVADSAIEGTAVSNLALSDSSFFSAGDSDGEHALAFDSALTTTEHNLTGVVTIDNCIFDDAAENSVDIRNFGGTLELTITDCTFRENVLPFGSDGLSLTFEGTATGTVTATTSTFTNLAGSGIVLRSIGTATTLTATLSGILTSSLTGSGVRLLASGSGVLHTNLVDNDVAHGGGFNSSVGTAVFFAANQNGSLDATFSNSEIGGYNLGRGIDVDVTDSADARVQVVNSTIESARSHALRARSYGTADADLQLDITDSTFLVTGSLVEGMQINSGSSPSDTANVCLHVAGTDSRGAPVGGGVFREGFAFFDQTGSTFALQNYGGGDLLLFLLTQGNGTDGGTPTLLSSGSFVAADCDTPAAP